MNTITKQIHAAAAATRRALFSIRHVILVSQLLKRLALILFHGRTECTSGRYALMLRIYGLYFAILDHNIGAR